MGAKDRDKKMGQGFIYRRKNHISMKVMCSASPDMPCLPPLICQYLPLVHLFALVCSFTYETSFFLCSLFHILGPRMTSTNIPHPLFPSWGAFFRILNCRHAPVGRRYRYLCEKRRQTKKRRYLRVI